MTEIDTALVLAAIGKLSFRNARTMPQWPHEYTIRKPEERELDKAFLKLHRAIRRFGKVEIFTGTKRPSAKKYLYPGDGYRYWPRARTRSRSRSSTATRSRARRNCASKA